jgi:hypothetical protein
MRDLTAKQQRFVAENRVSAAIEKAKQERLNRSHIEADQVLKALAAIAFLDPRTVLSEGSEGLRVKDEISPESRGAIAEVVERGYETWSVNTNSVS